MGFEGHPNLPFCELTSAHVSSHSRGFQASEVANLAVVRQTRVTTALGEQSADDAAGRQREVAFIKLLATAVAAYLKDGEEEPEADEPKALFEDPSACSNFSFDQADSLDFEQEGDS